MSDRRTNALAAVPPPEPWRWQLAVFLGYLTIGVVWTCPLILHWQTGVIQKGTIPVDAGQNIWNLWWVHHAIGTGTNPYITQHLFFPEQVNLFWQTLGVPNALLVLPVLATLGPIVAYNLLVLLSFGLSGYFTYRLARALLDSRVAALVAGFVFAFAPYHMQPLLGGALEIITVQWIPLYVLLLMRALHRPTILHVVGTGLMLVITTLVSQYYGLFCAVYTAGHFGLAFLLAQGRTYRLRLLASAIAIPTVWVVALLPFVWPLDSLGSATLEDWYSRQVFHSAALVDFFMLNVNHPLWGDLATRWSAALHPFGIEIGIAPGYVVYALIVCGCLRYWRIVWVWLLLALLLALLTLGPELKIGNEPTGIPLPFRLLDLFGPFRNSTRPSRFIPVMMLPVSVLAGYGLQALRTWQPRHRRSVAGLAGGALVVELLVAPWPILSLHVDPLYAQLHETAEPGAVLELPPRIDDSQYMVNQFCHGRPLAGGYLARTPGYPSIAYDSTMRSLWYAEMPNSDVFRTGPAAELNALGIRFVTLNLDLLSQSETVRLRDQLAAPGITMHTRSEQIEIYRVDTDPARPVLLPATGWHAAETDGQQTWRWMGDTATMQLRSRSGSLVSLSLALTAYQSPRSLRIWVDDTQVSETLVSAAPEEQTIRLSFIAPAGASELTLQSEAQPAPDGRQLSVSLTRLTFSSRPLAAGIQTDSTPMPPIVPVHTPSLCYE